MSLKFPVPLVGKRASVSYPAPDLNWVNVGDVSNPDDNTGYGGVSYRYGIGRYAVRESNIDAYNADPANASLQITLDDRGDDKPATNVTWNEAARYVNWLNIKDGAQPAYKFDTGGVNDRISLWAVADSWTAGGENRYRHKDAKYFLPSENEWYKAAYYKSGSTNAGYWLYPTGSDSAPTTTSGGTAPGTAVYQDGVNPNPPGPADVDNAGGLSPYGTMGQGGNVYEWMESARDGINDSTELRVLRGGYWRNISSSFLQSSFRPAQIPANENEALGFRVAKRLPRLEFVLIEDSGNPDDNTGYGGVSYDYRIGKYAISESNIDDYNADPANAGTLQITLTERGDDKPATDVTWNEAARYVNWLNIEDGAQPAYKFDTDIASDNISLWDVADSWTAGGENRYRHKDAKYFLPNDNEWYKAAYYKSGGTNAGYWLYPTGSDTAPVTTAGSTITGEAVYGGQSGPADVDNAGGLSPYGTMGQGGNVWEWIESALDGTNDSTTELRARRGGLWLNNSNTLQSSTRSSFTPVGESFVLGFRVAAVPD